MNVANDPPAVDQEADAGPAAVAPVLPRVDQNCAIGEFDELILVRKGAQQLAALPGGPVIVAVQRIGAHEFERAAEIAGCAQDRVRIRAHGCGE